MRISGFTLFAAAAATLVGAFSPAIAQPVVYGDQLAPFWHAAAHTRIDVVSIGDSNQLFAGGGWDRGWTRALASTTGLYASGLHSVGENGGNSSGVGDGTFTLSTLSTGAFTYNDAPAFHVALLNSRASLNSPLDYLHVAAGLSASGNASTGIVLDSTSPIDASGNLRFHLSYGLFEGEGPGSFRPAVRLNVPPYPNLCTGPLTSTRNASNALTHLTLDCPAAVRAGPLNFRMARAGIDTIVGPFIGYYARVENLDTTHGAALNTLYGYGGRSARIMAQFLADFTDESLTHYFTEVRRTQGPRKFVLVRLHSALNDRNEALPSITLGLTPGSSGPAFADNMQAMIDRCRSIYALNGWDDSDLYFLITPSHPIAPLDDVSLDAYRTAAETVAAANPRTAVARFDRLTTYTEMLAQSWYTTLLDRNHLSPAGYDALAQREVEALIAAAGCPADLDKDLDADSDDISTYFTLWDAGAREADADFDGDADSDDIVVFFAAWDSGC